jgi:hypothetical protein
MLYGENGYEIHASGKSVIITSKSDVSLSVMDITGRILINRDISAGTTGIPVELTGIYLTEVSGKSGSVSKKVLIAY